MRNHSSLVSLTAAAVLWAVLLAPVGGCTFIESVVPGPAGRGETTTQTSTAEATRTAGAARPSVPDVVGSTAADAERAFRDVGFDPYVVGLFTDQRPIGFVVEQYPAARRPLSEGSFSVLLVSFGSRAKGVRLVPEVRGVSLDTALQRLRARGLHVETNYRETRSAPDNVVMWQAPPPESSVEPGSVVVLLVARNIQVVEPEPPPEETEME
jgi:serine/threonine-protein kinase